MPAAGRKALVRVPARAQVRAVGKRRADPAAADPAAAKEAAVRVPKREPSSRV